MIEISDQEKQSFVKMPLADQLATIFDMLRYTRGEISSIRKNEIDFRIDLNDFKGELREVRRKREEREEKRETDLLTTTQKIKAVLEKRFDFWTYLRDKVLPQIITLVVIGLLYLVFGKTP